jgi:hypothetical protein
VQILAQLIGALMNEVNRSLVDTVWCAGRLVLGRRWLDLVGQLYFSVDTAGFGHMTLDGAPLLLLPAAACYRCC